MRAKRIDSKIILFLIACISSIGLSGCFKGEIAMDIKANGTGLVSIAIGLTQQAKLLLASQGNNPMQDMRQSMADGSGNIPKDVTVTKWVDGDYEWEKAEKKFNSFAEINAVMANKTLARKFSLKRNRGIFQDEFILDAEIDGMGTDLPADALAVDPSAFIKINFLARMPGEIAETNGYTDVNDPNLLVWTLAGNQTTAIYARSTVVNWLNIFGILTACVAFGLFGIYALGGFDAILYPSKKKAVHAPQSPGRAVPETLNVQQTPVRKTNYIVELGLEDLLNQVNTRAINSTGEIRRQPMEIALVWKDAQGRQRYIYIKDLGNHEIAVNGTNYPATRDNAKIGISSALQKQR